MSDGVIPGPVVLDGGALTIADVERVARAGARVELAPRASAGLLASRAVVERASDGGEARYGINTGFGSLARTRIARQDLRDLQRNLVRSHAAGVGPALARDVVRATMLLLAASLARGLSGVRPRVVELIVSMLNAGVTPEVPEVGSVGASGDLAPLAHLALVLIGEGRATVNGAAADGAEALRAAGLGPLTLEAKEGLALINGTHLMAARGALVLHDCGALVNAGLVATAMSIDACRATDSFLDDRVHSARAQPGQRDVAGQLRALLRGSAIIPSHSQNDPRVQDPYSIRCAPAVLGAAVDSLRHAWAVVERELGAVTDNPLVFAESGDVISAGNFHGMPLAIALDAVAIAVAHVAGISERRTYFMLGATDPEAQLTAYLSPRPGLHSGFMIAQYTAAACCNELVGLATPASVANVPTSAGTEDYNSFGPRSAAKAARAVELARWVVAVELLCAAQAVEAHRPLRSGDGVEAAIGAIRTVVPALTADRPPSPDIEAIAALIGRGGIAPETRLTLAP